MSITLNGAPARPHALQPGSAATSTERASVQEAPADNGWPNVAKGAIIGGIVGVVVGAGLLLSGVANSRYFINGAFAGSSLDLAAAAIVGGGAVAVSSGLGAGVGLVLDH